MKTAKIWAGCLLVILLVGALFWFLPHFRAKPLPNEKESSTGNVKLDDLIAAGGVAFRSGQFAVARNRFESALTLAHKFHKDNLNARLTTNVGACQFATHEYQAALHSYLNARRRAESDGETGLVAVLDANIASLYAQLGELDSAIQWLKGGIAHVSGKLSQNLPQMQIEMGSLLARQVQAHAGSSKPSPATMAQSLEFFRAGIDGADRAHNYPIYAMGWSRLGEELVRQGQTQGAERAFLEAYRVRKLHHLPLESSYWGLGELRLLQGDLTSSSALLDRAVDLTTKGNGPLPKWHLFDARGRVHLAQGRLTDAIADFRVATRLAHADRWSSPSADLTRLGSESILQQAYSDLIEAGNRQYFETRDPALIRETFEAAEENRADSLRQLLHSRQKQAGSLPPSYWEAIAKLEKTEIAALRSQDPKLQLDLNSSRAEVLRMEASLLADPQPTQAKLLDRSQASLRPDEVLMSFHLGRSISWLWVVDRERLMLYALPPRAEVEALARSATAAIREGSKDAPEKGARLYAALFGLLSARFHSKQHWLLSLDGVLFDVPLAALPDRAGQGARYLVEKHAVEVIPGAGYWVEASALKDRATSPVFLGIADPIYNTADPRGLDVQPKEPTPESAGFRLLAATHAQSSDRLTLPRLVGSELEVDRCSIAWKGERVLLKGADASRQKLTEQLQRRPAVVHFATHFLESSQKPSYGLIALSLNEQQEAELLQPTDIERWRIRAGVVVLSGCNSGAGIVLPGTGLLGLTRSWLIAGAQSVLASRWATPDEDGELFRPFYDSLRRHVRGGSAQALQSAQLAMLRRGGWRAQARYWGAYFVVGNQ